MKILITGAAGFIGSNLTKGLLDRGHSIVGLDNLSQGFLLNIEAFKDHPEFQFVEGDVRDEHLFSYLPSYQHAYAVVGGWYIHADSTESGTELGAPFSRHKNMNDFSGEIGVGIEFKPVSIEVTRLNHVYVRESPCCGPEYRQFFMLRINYGF